MFIVTWPEQHLYTISLYKRNFVDFAIGKYYTENTE